MQTLGAVDRKRRVVAGGELGHPLYRTGDQLALQDIHVPCAAIIVRLRFMRVPSRQRDLAQLRPAGRRKGVELALE